MTPKEKAQELYSNFSYKLSDSCGINHDIDYNPQEMSKEHALIVVHEIIEILKRIDNNNPNIYWQKVKTEINKL